MTSGEIRLEGCKTMPLMAYLKALGVLRTVAEQADGNVCGSWRGGAFVLQTNLDADGLVHFFLERYRPTPVIAPWAGGSGFFGSDNREAIDAISKSKSDALVRFALLIRQVQELLSELGIKNKPSPEEKQELLRRYRRELPDGFVDWMDAALVLHAAGQSFPPLLGTGGNDGRLDFTQNYMQRLVSLGFAGAGLVDEAEAWLRQALFATSARDLISAAVGQVRPREGRGTERIHGDGGECPS